MHAIISHPMFLRLFNVGLRMGALGMKLVLTLYMGRYFSLSDVGTYGLVASTVAIAIPLLGMRLDYVVSRELVDMTPVDVGRIMRDEAVFYALNYIVVGTVILAGMLVVPHDMNNTLILLALGLSILESFCTITSTNFIYLNKPILANFLFFMRSAAWTVPVIALGLYEPTYRDLNIVFGWWLLGLVVNLFITAYAVKGLPWREVFKASVRWRKIGRDVRMCIPIWLGSVGGVGAGNIDRFVAEYNLTRDMVGVLSFYGSFAGSISALVASGVTAFKQPVLISLHREKNTREFWSVAKDITIQSTTAAVFLSIGIGIVVPLMATYLNKPEISEYAPVLWLILLGIVMRTASESLNNVLYARHQDRAIWIGSLLLLVVSLGFNAALMPLFGLIGAGYSAIATSVFMVGWRAYCVKNYRPNDAEPLPVDDQDVVMNEIPEKN